ncbi:DUF2934 domain-containing protein [Pseudomonas sp. NPDC086251]|uniref:DUF2934 domain-containing protein n=1 Tax=Pseudomonas sp. NPDC086251 TaxID=3364431 RepID=UPI0038336535
MIDDSSIRERAYALWEKDACPEGAAGFYWQLARAQLEAQEQSKKADSCVVEFVGRKSELHPIFVSLKSKTHKATFSAKAASVLKSV